MLLSTPHTIVAHDFQKLPIISMGLETLILNSEAGAQFKVVGLNEGKTSKRIILLFDNVAVDAFFLSHVIRCIMRNGSI